MPHLLAKTFGHPVDAVTAIRYGGIAQRIRDASDPDRLCPTRELFVVVRAACLAAELAFRDMAGERRSPIPHPPCAAALDHARALMRLQRLAAELVRRAEGADRIELLIDDSDPLVALDGP